MSSVGTTVEYNGITLSNCLTKQWDEQVVYDDSGTDLIGQKYSLRFEGYLHAQSAGGNADVTGSPVWMGKGAPQAGDPDTMISHYEDIRRLLSKPRQTLKVFFGDSLVLHVEPATDINRGTQRKDVNNGPKPRNITVERVVGERLLFISFAIDVSLVECGSDGQAPDATLSNRWSVSEEMDDNFFTTRTISGKLYMAVGFRPGNGAADVKALEGAPPFRHKVLTVPPLERGFKRQKISFAVDRTGLICDYVVVDRQVHTSAPWPATKISGSHTESTTTGTKFFAAANVRLEGPPHANKKRLIETALRVIDSRLRFTVHKSGVSANTISWMPRQIAIIDHFGEVNAVDVRFAIEYYPPQGNVKYFLQDFITRLGEPLKLPASQGGAYDNTRSPVPSLHGYDSHGGQRSEAWAIVRACYLSFPCAARASLQADEPSEETFPEIEEVESYDPQAPSTPTLATGETHYSDTYGMDGFYTIIRMESSYPIHTTRVQLPIASRVDGGNETDPTSVFVRLARGQAKRLIRVEAERVGKYPEIPALLDTYNDSSLKGFLISSNLEMQAPTLAPNGVQVIYHTEAEYLYGLSRPPTASEKLRVGVLRHTNLTQDDNALPLSEVFKTELGP